MMGVACAAAACGGGDSTDGAGGGANKPVCFDYSGWDGSAPAVSFQSDVLPILRRSCGLSSSCHGSASNPPGYVFLGPAPSAPPPSALDLQAMFDSMLAPATEATGMARVKPGAPDQSFLMYKLDGDFSCKGLTCDPHLGCGTSMPQASSLLSADERDLIRRWIAQGAQNDAGGGKGAGGGGGSGT
jgi:hypothetical protein